MQYNFGTVTEHPLIPCSVHTKKTRSINFGAWISFVIFVLTLTSLVLQCVQNLCREGKNRYFLHVAGQIITWRLQLGNLLYTEHTNQAKIPSNLHYVGGVYKKVHIALVPLQQWHEKPNSWPRLWDEMKDWRLWVTEPQR